MPLLYPWVYLATPIKKAMELNRGFSKEEIKMAKKYLSKCSISLTIREIQPKAMKFHLFTVRMSKISKQLLARMWQKMSPHSLLLQK